MDNESNLIRDKIKKHSKQFSLFLTIGILKTVLTVALTWLFIDFLQLEALLSSTVVVLLAFFITYYAYVATKLIKPEFIKYTSTTIGFNIANILLIWLFVDFLGLSGAVSSAIVIGGLFILRYIFFRKIGVIG